MDMDQEKENKEELFLQDIREIAEQMEELSRQAESQYRSVITYLIGSGCQDSQEIEHTLDGLLDFACDKKILSLYRTLCRYYYSLDPVAAVYYVKAYREMWDPEDELFASGYFKRNPV